MSTTTTTRTEGRTDERAARAPRPTPTRPPAKRLVAVELRKMFDTRAGAWLCAGVVVLSLAATGLVIAFAPDSALTFDTFGTAVGAPMSILLPVIAILAVTSEWSQRSGLGTFTMVPQRSRVLGAKLAATVVVGVVSMLVALGVGALGTLVGSAVTGVDPVWDVAPATLAAVVTANLASMLVGFVLGLLTRSSAAGLVGYFVFAFVWPTASGMLAAYQGWWRDLSPWLDLQLNQFALFDGWPTGAGWAHLAVSTVTWLLLPALVGAWLVSRSEVK